MDVYAGIRAALRSGVPPPPVSRPNGPPGPEVAAWRFLHAWSGSGRLGADHAVLLRQLARARGGFLGEVDAEFAALLRRAGVEVGSDGWLRAEPFRPEWLPDSRGTPDGIEPRPDLRRRDESFPAERWLGAAGYVSWQSQAQKEAVWTVLDAPAGSTTLVALPTGSGKSLCFQVLPYFGAGLTVVVVPTVALALDQWRGAVERLGELDGVNPRYFAAGDPAADADGVVDDVRAGRTRLLFASPEACVSGRLRAALDEAAAAGRFEHLVVDEAHIIESWGAFFRIDFQVLATRRKQWLELSKNQLRTVLLSATFTPASKTLLRNLFGVGGEWRELAAQRLRPEPAYFVRTFEREEPRRAAVAECAWRLPRPAIFYTTAVDDAKALHAALEAERFERVGCFTGDTPPAERARLLDAWRRDELDLMVATSAFGLGVDKGDVRSVVHVCLPETLHRYYQEVGRSGRDGWSSTCVLLPTPRDREVADGLSPRLMTAPLLQARWEALWATREPAEAEGTWRLRTDARRSGLLGTRTWTENVLWNKRLLLQLVRAGLLELLDLDSVPGGPRGERVERVTVRPGFPPHSPKVGETVLPFRDRELRDAEEGLERMRDAVRGARPLCRTLKAVYGEETQRACGGCPGCRSQERPVRACPPLELPEDGRAQSSVARAVVAGGPHPLRDESAFRRLLRRIVESGTANRFVCGQEVHAVLLAAFASAFGLHPPVRVRLDTFGQVPFLAREHETLVVLHLDELDRVSLPLRAGRAVVHLVPRGTPYLDENRRFPFEAEDGVLFTTPEEWLSRGDLLVH
jgi:ATP-dependent DNA helicase RecQ